jgi:hypothetical protein
MEGVAVSGMHGTGPDVAEAPVVVGECRSSVRLFVPDLVLHCCSVFPNTSLVRLRLVCGGLTRNFQLQGRCSLRSPPCRAAEGPGPGYVYLARIGTEGAEQSSCHLR